MPLTPLMADLDAVRKAFGCKDETLLQRVLDSSGVDDDDTDAGEYEFEDDDDDDPDVPEELPSSQDALRHIIIGEPWVRGIAGNTDTPSSFCAGTWARSSTGPTGARHGLSSSGRLTWCSRSWG